jgi:preprotein translocase subunit SecD
MRWICLLTGLLLFTFLPARAGHSPPKVFLRVHVQTTGEGQSPQEATTITIPPDGERIQVRTMPEVSENELVDVQQDASGVVHLRFNHVGQVNLNAVTAQNQGRILVVLIDGQVVYAPTIDEQITNGELNLPRPLNPQVLQLLQEVAQRNVKQAAKT